MRVLVTGGRDFTDAEFVARALDKLHAERGPISVIIHGAYRGADTLAKEWAKARGIPHIPFPADWSRGKKGGPERNQRMVDEGAPDCCVAFPGHDGTADCVARFKASGRTKLWDLRGH